MSNFKNTAHCQEGLDDGSQQSKVISLFAFIKSDEPSSALTKTCLGLPCIPYEHVTINDTSNFNMHFLWIRCLNASIIYWDPCRQYKSFPRCSDVTWVTDVFVLIFYLCQQQGKCDCKVFSNPLSVFQLCFLFFGRKNLAESSIYLHTILQCLSHVCYIYTMYHVRSTQSECTYCKGNMIHVIKA